MGRCAEARTVQRGVPRMHELHSEKPAEGASRETVRSAPTARLGRARAWLSFVLVAGWSVFSGCKDAPRKDTLQSAMRPTTRLKAPPARRELPKADAEGVFETGGLRYL